MQARHRHAATDIQLQLKSKFTQLKLLNCSEKSINAHTHSQHNENAMKNYQPTGNQYSRQSLIRIITWRN